MAGKQLTIEAATFLAEALTTISGDRRYWPKGAVSAMAFDLMRWCTGAILDNRVWTPEDQATWLVTEARENWKEWPEGATSLLKDMLEAKFYPKAPEREWTPDGTGCGKCGGSGWTVVERDGVSGAARCPECKGIPVPNACPICQGKETVLADDGYGGRVRQFCSCVSESRREQLRRFGKFCKEPRCAAGGAS